MALNTQVPILPLVVKGGFRFKPKNRWYIKPSIIDIEVGEPIDVTQYSIKNLDDLVHDTHNQFKKLLDD